MPLGDLADGQGHDAGVLFFACQEILDHGNGSRTSRCELRLLRRHFCLEFYTAANCLQMRPLAAAEFLISLRDPGLSRVSSAEVVHSTNVPVDALFVLDPCIINIGPDTVPLVAR